MEQDLKHFQANYTEQRNAKQAAERRKRGNWQAMDLGELLEVESKSPDSKPTWVEATGQPLRSSDFLDSQFMKVRRGKRAHRVRPFGAVLLFFACMAGVCREYVLFVFPFVAAAAHTYQKNLLVRLLFKTYYYN
jgi:hypothetical protein